MSKFKRSQLKNRKHQQLEIISKKEEIISAEDASFYLLDYMIQYGAYFYNRFTAPPPNGAGYPRILISPYVNLHNEKLTCHLAKDGAVITASAKSGNDNALIKMNVVGVSSDEVNEMPKPEKTVTLDNIQNTPDDPEKPTTNSKLDFTLYSYNLPLDEVWNKISLYGLYFVTENSKQLISNRSKFWDPLIIRNMSFETGDGKYRRDFSYIEILFHSDKSAWDRRSIHTRVLADIRRDYAYTVAHYGKKEAVVSVRSQSNGAFFERLELLRRAIINFENLLNDNPDGEESIFHDFLKANPLLLDVYGEVLSKPRFKYPVDETPLGKKYVEPDFIIKYSGNRYKLVELERPGKLIATAQGQPRSEVTQSTFQIAEWEHYIRNHYEIIKNQYPGIANYRTSMVVISRNSERSFGQGRDFRAYMDVVSQQFKINELLTYDDLLDRAKQAYTQLSSLGIPST